jgi:hypothetical protein
MRGTTLWQSADYTHTTIEEQRWMEEGGRAPDERSDSQETDVGPHTALAPTSARGRLYRKAAATQEAHQGRRRSLQL